MNAKVQYTLYHPKWYRRHVSVWWWLKTWSYTKFVLRELTSLSVAFYALITLWLIGSLVRGPEAYAQFLDQMRSPVFLAMNLVALIFVLFHTITWFHLAPKALVLRLGGHRVPDYVIVALNYVVWIVASALISWIVLRE